MPRCIVYVMCLCVDVSVTCEGEGEDEETARECLNLTCTYVIS